MEQAKLMIIRGLPGSGKSTYAKKLAKKYNIDHFENDQFLMHGDDYVWTPKDAKIAAKKCFDCVIDVLKSGKNCIVSNVFVSKKAIDMYVDAAKELGAEVIVVRMTGDFGNVHNVPKMTLNSMKSSFQDYDGEIIQRPNA